MLVNQTSNRGAPEGIRAIKNDRSATDKSHSAYKSFLVWWEGVDGLSDDDNSPVHQYNQALDYADDYSSDDGHDQVIGPLRADAYLMTTFLQDAATLRKSEDCHCWNTGIAGLL